MEIKKGNNNGMNEIAAALSSANRVLIAGHINPDGDAIGACLALAMCLNAMGKQVYVALERYNPRYDIIAGSELIVYDDIERLSPDTFVSLDCGGIDRLGYLEPLFRKTPCTIVIDHHLSNNYFGGLNFVDIGVSSTCEIVYALINELKGMTKDIAAALYAGIIFDTGGLKHNSTSVKTLEIIGDLMNYGIPFTEIYNGILSMKSYSEAMIFARAISKTKFFDGFPVAYTTITMAERLEVGATPRDLEGIAEYILNIIGVEFSVFAYEKSENDTKISMRSKKMDANEIAGHFGGGGHRLAAGCTIFDNADGAVNQILTYIKGKIT